jgi:ankyrin repeat protein
MGRTKVFIRPKAFEALEHLRIQRIERSAILIQSTARMFLETIHYELSQIAVIIIQTEIRKFCAVRRAWRVRLFRRAVTIQKAWRLFAAHRRLWAALTIAKWCQSARRGAIAREQCVILLLERKASTIQRFWRRRSRGCSGLRSFYKLRSAFVSLQALYRMHKAITILKQLKVEARDLTHVAKERDEFREETRRLREELERAKREAEQRGQMSKEAEVRQLKTEVEKLRQELERARQFSPTLSHADELGFLTRECELKELQLKGLRSEMADWRQLKDVDSLSPCNCSKDSTLGAEQSFEKSLKVDNLSQKVIDLLKSPGHSSATSISLLDADNPEEGYLDEGYEAISAMSQDNTTTAMSLSYSMNTPNLRGEAFFIELRRLHDAVRSSDLDLIEEVLRQSSEETHVLINEGDEVGRTSLHAAVLTSNLLVTKTLLEKGGIANAQDNDGETPLHLAETASMTTLLLKDGRANPNIPNIDGICALHLAVQRRDLDSVRALLLHNANVNSADNVRWFIPLHLIALPARGSPSDEACEGEVRCRIAELMSGGATSRYEPELNYQDSEGNCPLHYAVQLVTADAYDLIKVFLEHGSDPKVLNNRSQSALHLICHNNKLRKFDFYPDLLRMVLFHGADPNQQSAAGCTALHLSLYHRDIDSAVELVANGAQLHPLWKKVRDSKHAVPPRQQQCMNSAVF